MKPNVVLFIWMLSIVIVMTEFPENVEGILVVLHRGRVGRLRTVVKKNFRIERKPQFHNRSEIKKRLKRPHHKRIPKSIKVGHK